MARKKANPSSQLEIDHAILDYLVADALGFLISSAQRRRSQARESDAKGNGLLHLNMVDSFLTIFRTLHPSSQPDPDVAFRLRLLRFTVLFIEHKSPSIPTLWNSDLHQTGKQHRKLAKRSSQKSELSDLTQHLKPDDNGTNEAAAEVIELDTGHKKPAQELEATPLNPEKPTTTMPALSLLDILPSFMALSAAELSIRQGSQITPTWMRLAAGFMTHAVIEQHLDLHSQRSGIVEEAFASWGFDTLAEFADEATDEYLINVMFFDDEAEAEYPEWRQIKQEHINALVPPAGEDLLKHLEWLRSNQLSLKDFDQRMIAFIDGLAQSLPPPALSQISWRQS